MGALLQTATPAAAQDRSADNAIAQAEDGFGFSVGRESLGIYSATNARGFSPTAAGNLRIDGLYYDSAYPLTSAINDSTSIKVGLAAQGYPFAAPSGIVDLSLRRPGDRRAASIIVNGDSYGTYGAEIDGSLPVNKQLSIGYGLAGSRIAFYDGTSNLNHGEALAVRWRPRPGIEILPFWTLYNDYKDEAGPFYAPAGAFLPPNPPERRYDGPGWSQFRVTGVNYGLLASASLGRNWLFRLGAFRSVNDVRAGFTNLDLDEQPDGRAEHVVIADPRETNASLSGEARLSHTIVEGPRTHVFHLSFRERDARHQYGGSDTIDLGPVQVGVASDPPKPVFDFGPNSRDRVRQSTIGLAYGGQWKGIGQISLGLSRANYDKTTVIPGLEPVESRSHPWLYNGSIALYASRALAIYAGYARGLEESGVAPPNAANRNQPLPAILTSQADAGLRWTVAGLKVIAGVFDLRKPYFGFGPDRRYAQLGAIRSRGVEASVSGKLTSRLDLVAGGVFLNGKVEGDPATLAGVGRKPVGLAPRSLNANLNWRTPILKGLSLDAAVTERGKVPATTDNLVAIPPRTLVNLGGHYQFKLAGNDVTLRLQATNLFDVRSFTIAGPGVYTQNPGRAATGYLTIDI